MKYSTEPCSKAVKQRNNRDTKHPSVMHSRSLECKYLIRAISNSLFLFHGSLEHGSLLDQGCAITELLP